MVLVDTSVWIEVFRDSSGKKWQRLVDAAAGESFVLTRFSEFELLLGARDESEWDLLKGYLNAQDLLELSEDSWTAAARIYFDLRRLGRTVSSPIDCCIAQIAMEHEVLLIHRDRDFETIARIRPLRHLRLRW